MGAMCCACMADSRCRGAEVQRDQQMMITGIKGRTLEWLGAIGLANLMSESAQAEAALQKTGRRAGQGRAGRVRLKLPLTARAC